MASAEGTEPDERAAAPASGDAVADQLDSGGSSMTAIVEEALAASRPEPGLRWLDVGCGRGELLRRVRDEWAPARLGGLDVIDWLDDDLRADVSFETVGLEEAEGLAVADRVLMVEVIEHLPSPWTALRKAAGLLAPGGRIVVTTPNIATLRSRLELGLRGNLTSFRPGYTPHMTPALPHVTAHVLEGEGLVVETPRYAGADVISLSGGRTWPRPLRERWPRLTSISVVLAAARDAQEI
jgi:cyclopropane fatty-acyl-phospholipid synthase-like methyltransferase